MRKPDPKTRTWRIALGLALVTLAVYWPVTHHEFIQYDDQDYVTTNEMVQRGLTIEGVRWAFTEPHAANWHPVTWLSHMLDCQFFGLAPGGHHLVSVAFHAINAALLFILLQFLTRATGRSAFVAALFASHPLHIESVAWVAERKDVLSTCFGLLTLYAYSAYARCGPERRSARFGYYALALTLFALGLMSKPMLVTLPFLLLLLDCWPLERLNGERGVYPELGKLLIEKLPFFALSALSSVITMQVQQAGMTFYASLPFAARAANAVISIPRYLAKTFCPRNLAVLYPYPDHWPSWQIAAATATVLILTALVVWQWKQRPYLAIGWFWFLGTLVPVLGLVQVGVQSMADRYTYLPLVGLFIMVAWVGNDCRMAMRWSARTAFIAAAMIVLGAAVVTRWQLRVWRNTESIFTQAIRVTLDNWVAHYNLALLAMQRYQDQQRSPVASQLLAREPGRTESEAPRDYLSEIARHCETVIAIKPGFPDPRITLAKALTEQGRLAEARTQLDTAIRLAPENAEARQNLAEILLRQGQLKPALTEYRRALELQPDWPPVLNNLAWILATHPDRELRNGTEAVRLAQRACQLSGHTNLWFLHTLAAAHAEAGDFTNAVAVARQARELATASNQPALIDLATRRIELYQSGQQHRQ